jgi:hypothetical protein
VVSHGPCVHEVSSTRAGGDVLGALELALVRWRETRAPEIAEAIDALDAELGLVIDLPASKRELSAAWHRELLARGTAATGALARSAGSCLVANPSVDRERPPGLGDLLGRVAPSRSARRTHGSLRASSPSSRDRRSRPLSQESRASCTVR